MPTWMRRPLIWLSAWLISLGAKVCGYSRDIPTTPSLFELSGLAGEIEHHIGDVRDLEKLSGVIQSFRPDFVFHLAAQAMPRSVSSSCCGTSRNSCALWPSAE